MVGKRLIDLWIARCMGRMDGWTNTLMAIFCFKSFFMRFRVYHGCIVFLAWRWMGRVYQRDSHAMITSIPASSYARCDATSINYFEFN